MTMSERVFFSTGSGKIVLVIKAEDAKLGYHSGQCDADISALRRVPYITRQLSDLPRDDLASELKEYGAWNAEELADHDANLSRILWLACGDIVDSLEDAP
jgi:hypothetical protein